MIIHQIHDLSNQYVTNLLKQGLATVNNNNYVKNYHPDYSTEPSNLFFILDNGRFRQHCGKYFVIEMDNKYVCSAGWNEYELDSSTALLLTRMYTVPEHRTKFYVGNYILPLALKEAQRYDNIWMTCNEYNKVIYDWFVRASTKQSRLGNWPDTYKNFKPAGKKDIYYTEQYVVEFLKG